MLKICYLFGRLPGLLVQIAANSSAAGTATYQTSFALLKMKQIFLAVLALMMMTGVNAQTNPAVQNCPAPMSNFEYQQRLRGVQAAKTDGERLTAARELLRSGCVTAAQVKDIALLFQNDFDRLDFAKAAFARTFDQNNFYEVYDAFMYFSTVFRLHDATRPAPAPVEQRPPANAPANPAATPRFPAVNYPDHTNYKGRINCSSPMSDAQFNTVANNMFGQTADAARLLIGLDAAANQCLSTAQAMRLASLMELEQNKVNFLRQAYTRVFDVANYPQAVQILSSQASQQELLNFVNNQNSPVTTQPTNPTTTPPATTPAAPPCNLSVAEFNQMKATIQAQRFENTRISGMRQALRSKKCISTAQVRELLKMFSFEASKLDLAKFAHEFVHDKDNYYTVSEEFSFDSSKEDFNRFLEGKK